jgi:hypothetical protein
MREGSVAEGSVLRLLAFAPEADGGVIDAELRRAAALLGERPATAVHVARRHGTTPERIVVSVWPSVATMRDALAIEVDGERSLLELPDRSVEARVEVLPLAVDLTFGDAGEALVLRVYRGRIRAGELEAYLDDARAGTLADDAAGRGPLALHLAVEEPDRFVTVSAWTGWDRIEAATGGNVRNPVTTRHPERLLDGTVRHYEILPRSASDAAAPRGSA